MEATQAMTTYSDCRKIILVSLAAIIGLVWCSMGCCQDTYGLGPSTPAKKTVADDFGLSDRIDYVPPAYRNAEPTKPKALAIAKVQQTGYVGKLPGLRWDANLNSYVEIPRPVQRQAPKQTVRAATYNAPVYWRDHPGVRQGWTGDLRRHLTDRQHRLTREQISRMSARACVNRHETDHGFRPLYGSQVATRPADDCPD